MNEQYKQDSHGRLVPIESIKEIDLMRDDLVTEIVTQAKQVHEALAAFKNKAFGDVRAFVELSAEKYGARIGGRKGNVSLLSFDGKYKVLIANQDHIVFDERIQAAKSLIDECIKGWTAGASMEIKALIDRAFEVDKEGRLNTGRILTLRRVNISDPRWQEAMKAISDSVQVVGSKSYVRVYCRKSETDEYEQMALDIAGV